MERVLITTKLIKIPSLLIVLLVSAFSTVSISTNYFESIQTSTLGCQPQTNSNVYGGALTYTITGIQNTSADQNIKIECPVDVGSAESSSYEVLVVVAGIKNNSSGEFSCQLNEIQNIDGSRLQVLTQSEVISGTQPTLLLWKSVVKQALENNSTFTVTCNLPPKSVLTSIDTRKYN
jgi:hypothetical protein